MGPEGKSVSNIVPLKAFPEADLLAWLQARQWWDACNGSEREGDAALPVVVSAPRIVPVPIREEHAPPPTLERSRAIEDAPPVRRSAGRVLLALVLFIAAVGLAVVGLTVNTRFAASFGQTAEAALLLAAIGLTIDLLAIVLPSAAAQLWRD